MTRTRNFQLVFNAEKHSHRADIIRLLKGAKQLDCMVAFAKTSGGNLIMKPLIARLESGLKARFAISLNFFQTDPDLLWKLLKLTGKYHLSLYLSNSERTFHPKLYALSSTNGCFVLVGSANLTSGGLETNYEASALINDPSGTLSREVAKYIDELIERQELVGATKERIDEYRRQHRIYHALQTIKDARFDRTKRLSGANFEILQSILHEMKNDSSERGFRAQKLVRRKCLREAFDKIKALASAKKLNSKSFLVRYEQLLDTFHSGGLHRGKNVIANNADKFQSALAAILRLNRPAAGQAFQVLLDYFENIPRAGVNVLTEILLALDSQRFAVMNQNAISGVSLANIDDFPAKPNKSNVSAETYAHYCRTAAQIRDDLGLRDFAELDALFNYAYWRHDEIGEDE
jgi:HKD family nuclease